MSVPTENLNDSIMGYARALPEGALLSATTFAHLGNRAAVDQALSRLVKRGGLLRADRGLYLLPVEGRFGSRAPSVEKVLHSFAGQRGERVVASGAAAANSLGLTTQVPVRLIYLTSGRSRSLKIGQQGVELRHAPGWQLALGEELGGQIIRALAWLGPESASAALPSLQKRLERGDRETLAGVLGGLPGWLAGPVSRLVHG